MVAAQARARAASEASDDEYLEMLKAEGMQINEVDTTGFREAVQPVYDEITSTVDGAAEYIARIEEALGR